VLDEETLSTVRKALNDEVLPRHLQNFDRLVQKSPSGWLAGGPEPTIADFMVVPRLEWLVKPGVHMGISTSLLDGYPNLLKLIKKFNDLPAIKKYYAKSA
jgi:glutathione S-transferase